MLAAAAFVGGCSLGRFHAPLAAARVGLGRGSVVGDLDARASERDGPPEVRRLAGEFNRTTAKLATLLTSQEQFVADASHELRTPLTALRLRLENDDAEAALVEVERLARLVDELLALARADSTSEPAQRLAVAAEVASAGSSCGSRWRPSAA